MVHVKSVMGLVLVVVALYFLSTAFPALARFADPGARFLLAAFAITLAGVLFGSVHKSFEGASLGVKLSKALGIVLTSGGAFLFLMGWIKPAGGLMWEGPSDPAGITTLTERARKKALDEARPLLVDFTAAWCAACKEIDKLTFTDERVQREAGRFVAVKVDATDDDDPLVVATMKEHVVRGLPTLILFDSDGAEAQRFTDFVDAEAFLDALEQVN
jgi:thiol:disulfide interchange protein DsbD